MGVGKEGRKGKSLRGEDKTTLGVKPEHRNRAPSLQPLIPSEQTLNYLAKEGREGVKGILRKT